MFVAGGFGGDVTVGGIGEAVGMNVGEAVAVGFNIAAVVGVQGGDVVARLGVSVRTGGEQAATALQMPKIAIAQGIQQRSFILFISLPSCMRTPKNFEVKTMGKATFSDTVEAQRGHVEGAISQSHGVGYGMDFKTHTFFFPKIVRSQSLRPCSPI